MILHLAYILTAKESLIQVQSLHHRSNLDASIENDLMQFIQPQSETDMMMLEEFKLTSDNHYESMSTFKAELQGCGLPSASHLLESG